MSSFRGSLYFNSGFPRSNDVSRKIVARSRFIKFLGAPAQESFGDQEPSAADLTCPLSAFDVSHCGLKTRVDANQTGTFGFRTNVNLEADGLQRSLATKQNQRFTIVHIDLDLWLSVTTEFMQLMAPIHERKQAGWRAYYMPSSHELNQRLASCELVA
ncbi:hypothetical protein BKA80DRAFT_5709 [Phyllosticta citrichinensis]